MVIFHSYVKLPEGKQDILGWHYNSRPTQTLLISPFIFLHVRFTQFQEQELYLGHFSKNSVILKFGVIQHDPLPKSGDAKLGSQDSLHFASSFAFIVLHHRQHLAGHSRVHRTHGDQGDQGTQALVAPKIQGDLEQEIQLDADLI